jgi:methionine-R-sulfoxide reductase
MKTSMPVILLLISWCAGELAADEMHGGWRATQNKVSELVSGLTARVSTYDPDARLIHRRNSELDFPMRLSDTQWRDRLTADRYDILRRRKTEPAFSGALNDNKAQGIYYSAATGQPLFSSEDKYDSGTGWPSFTRPIHPDAVAYRRDPGLFGRRIEVIDSLSGSHLGHVFSDGPQPTGQRYCMNSAALVFVPEGGDPPELLLPKQ